MSHPNIALPDDYHFIVFSLAHCGHVSNIWFEVDSWI